MRILAAALLVFALPMGALAQARQYAILSLVGDELTIVSREMTTGSRIEKNSEFKVPLGDRKSVV